ncbi:MAG: glutathione S-transferase family protein [Gammaproteobacteria bacterium]
MELELISFKLCPFVQRSVIALKHVGMDYRITFIDLNNPPDWFPEVSPFEKVPVLRVHDGDKVTNIFESAVIAELVQELSDKPLHPEDPVTRAYNRSWIEVASSCFEHVFHLTGAEDEKAYKQQRQALLEKLDMMEEVIAGPYFNGEEPYLVDFATAPLFMRLEILGDFYDREEYPKVAAWSDALLALPVVQDSVVPEFEMLFKGMVKNRSAFTAEKHGIA